MKNLLKNIRKRLNGNGKINGKKYNGEIIKHTSIIPIAESEIIKGNIYDLSYKMAGRNNGDPKALDNGLEMVRSGKIADEKNSRENHKEDQVKIDQEINDKRKSIQSIDSEIKKIEEVEITFREGQIKNRNEEIDVQEKIILRGNSELNMFNYIIFWTLFVIGGIYLYLFYISAFHSAFFRDIADEVANVNSNSIRLIINSVFNSSAFSEFNLHWVAPVIFFVFAVVFHISLDSRGWVKWLFVSGIMLFVLFADGLLAYFIEKNNHMLHSLMGMAEDNWLFYKSPVFCLVLYMGFFTSLGWSIILHKLVLEYNKKDYERIARNNINSLRKKIYGIRDGIRRLKAEIINKESEIKNHKSDIHNLKNERDNFTFSLVELQKNLNTFYNGWLAYINGIRNNTELKDKCQEIYNNFKQKFLNQSNIMQTEKRIS